MKKIGFIGAGKVGASLGRHIKERGASSFSVSGYYSRDPASARSAADFTESRVFDAAEALAEHCDLLLLTVPDDRIADVWKSVSSDLTDKRARPLCVGHCSGSLSAAAFGTKPSGLSFGSIHPLQAIHNRETGYGQLSDVYFTIEGDAAFIGFAQDLLTKLGNPYATINASEKTRYHAASVFISNLICALTYTGTEVLKSCGLDDTFAENAWRALFLGNAKNIALTDPIRALTGPVERGDAATVARHLEALSGDTREIYRLLSNALTDIARQKNPDRDYSKLAALLAARQTADT